MRVRYAAKSDVGMKRAHNEDHFAIVPGELLFLVADGMGGHASGEVASRLAAETIVEFFRCTREDEEATWPYGMDRSLSYEENRLVCGIRLANQRICELAWQEPHMRGMGTTIVAAMVVDEQLHVAHAGDSRAYLLRDGILSQLTRDHSLLEDYREAGALTPEGERNFPHKNVITRALGIRPSVEVAIAAHSILPRDVYLLCSDGLSGMVEDDQLCRLLSRGKALDRAVFELVDAANRNGGTDNITALLFECSPTT